MISGLLCAACALAALGSAISWWSKNRRFYVLGNKIPGAPNCALIGNMIIAMKVKFDPWHLIEVMRKQIGDPGIMRFWRGLDLFVLISEPSYMQTFYSDPALYKRNDMYDSFDPWLGKDNILSAENEPWKKLRKVLVRSFNAMNPNNVVSAIVTEADKFVEDMKKYNGEWFESISDLGMLGNRIFSNISLDEDIDKHNDIRECLMRAHTLLRGIVLRVLSFLHFFSILYPWTKNGTIYKSVSELLNRRMLDLVTKKKAEFIETGKSGKTVPNTYINNIFEKYPECSLEEVSHQVITMFGAGVDTTVTSLGYAFIMLGMHPEVQELILKEDAEIQSRLEGRPLEASDLPDYEYLERVIWETLRIYPIFPIIGRVVRDKEVQLGKYTLPIGTNVILSFSWAHRRSDLFPEPEKFIPDRHLPENTKHWHPYAFQPFSSGGKSCVGSKFAMMSLKILISTLVRHFKIHTEYKTLEEVDKNLQGNVIVSDGRSFRIRLEKRS